MKKLIIFGTGDIAQIANFYFEKDSDYDPVAFCVDGDYLESAVFEKKPVVAFENLISDFPPSDYYMFLALSYSQMNKFRQKKYTEAKEKGYDLASYISSKCSYMSQFPPGDNSFIFEDNTIQPFVKIGNNNTLWSGNHIGHHSVIRDNNFISSHVVISGHCEIKNNCFIGVNATLHNNIIVEEETLIAAGATISKNTIQKGVYLPAQTTLYKKNSSEIGF